MSFLITYLDRPKYMPFVCVFFHSFSLFLVKLFSVVYIVIVLVYMASETEHLKKMHSLAISYDLVKNIFLKALFNTKSNDLICDLFIGQASSP